MTPERLPSPGGFVLLGEVVLGWWLGVSDDLQEYEDLDEDLDQVFS